MAIRRTRLYCHACNGNFTAELEMDLNGNHEIKCPNCDHIHYRFVRNGEVTDERWRSSAPTYYAYSYGYTVVASIGSNSTGSAFYLAGSWAATSGTTTGAW